MKTIAIDSNGKEITVSWSHESLFNNIIKLQRSILFLKEDEYLLHFKPTEDIADNVQKFFNNLWSRALEEQCYDNLPDNPTIVDIGSGIGIMNVIAYKHLGKTGKFYLLDKSERTYSANHNMEFYHSANHGFYNSRLVTTDVVESSECDLSAFSMIEPGDEWPDEVDLITSWVSYCWHYPLETYWDKVKKHLKVGGKFAIEVLRSADDEFRIIERVSKEFKSIPNIQVMAGIEGNKGGYRCIWIRNE